MTKTLMIAAALLTFGVGSAFAGEDFPGRTPLPANSAISQQVSGGQSHLYAASARSTTNVYSQFARPGYTQGGNE